MVIFPLAPDQTIAQMWSNGARGVMSKVKVTQCLDWYSTLTSQLQKRKEKHKNLSNHVTYQQTNPNET